MRRRQRGNALIFALLGLLISALGALGVIQGSRLQARHEAGNGEATILDNLRGAANNAIFEGMGLIQNGAAFSKNGVTITPVDRRRRTRLEPDRGATGGDGLPAAGLDRDHVHAQRRAVRHRLQSRAGRLRRRGVQHRRPCRACGARSAAGRRTATAR